MKPTVCVLQREDHHPEEPEQFSNASPISASIADPPLTAMHKSTHHITTFIHSYIQLL
jgi:hypothetical protein